MRLLTIGLTGVSLLALATLPLSAADYAPSILYASVLNGLKLQPKTGRFRLDVMYAVFLPEVEARPGSLHPYNPDDGAALWAILSRQGQDAEDIGRYDFWAEDRDGPFWYMSSYRLTDLRSGESMGQLAEVQLQPGDYVLRFHLETGEFLTIPFGVSVVASADPFAGGDTYYLDGEWRDWGYFYYADADPESSIQWKIWLRHKGEDQEKSVQVRLGLMRVSENNKLIATNRPNVTYRLGPEWIRYEFDLIEPMRGTSGGAMRYAKQILVDGSYVLKFVVDDETYGLWHFDVKNGRFVPAGRTVRGEASPLTFVEGGADAFWYRRDG